MIDVISPLVLITVIAYAISSMYSKKEEGEFTSRQLDNITFVVLQQDVYLRVLTCTLSHYYIIILNHLLEILGFDLLNTSYQDQP